MSLSPEEREMMEAAIRVRRYLAPSGTAAVLRFEDGWQACLVAHKPQTRAELERETVEKFQRGLAAFLAALDPPEEPCQSSK